MSQEMENPIDLRIEEVPIVDQRANRMTIAIICGVYALCIYPLAGVYGYLSVNSGNECDEGEIYYIVSLVSNTFLIAYFICIRRFFHKSCFEFTSSERFLRFFFDIFLTFTFTWYSLWQEKISKYDSCKEHSYAIWKILYSITIFWLSFHGFILLSLYIYYLHKAGILNELRHSPKPSLYGIIILIIYIFVILPLVISKQSTTVFYYDYNSGTACQNEFKSIQSIFSLYTTWTLFFIIYSGFVFRPVETQIRLYSFTSSFCLIFGIIILSNLIGPLIKLNENTDCRIEHQNYWSVYCACITISFFCAFYGFCVDIFNRFWQRNYFRVITLAVNFRKFFTIFMFYGAFVGVCDIAAIIIFITGDICTGYIKLWLVLWVLFSSIAGVSLVFIAFITQILRFRQTFASVFTFFMSFLITLNFFGFINIKNDSECREDHPAFWVLCLVINAIWFYVSFIVVGYIGLLIYKCIKN